MAFILKNWILLEWMLSKVIQLLVIDKYGHLCICGIYPQKLDITGKYDVNSHSVIGHWQIRPSVHQWQITSVLLPALCGEKKIKTE